MRGWFSILVICLVALGSQAENRFPKPQFESGYAMPSPGIPTPRVSAMELLDIGVLAATLALAAWLVLRKRSRRGIYLVSVFSLLYFGFWRKGCVCSIGSIQNVAVWLSDSGVVLPFTVIAFFLLPLLSALFWGRVFCSGVCPLGAIQEMTLLYPLRLPDGLTRVLKMVPVVYLGMAVLLAVTGSSFVICRYDPFIAIFRLGGELPLLVAGIVLLLLGIVVARPYCRFLCPYSVLLAHLSKVSKWHATITPDGCVRCRLCETACPFDAIRMPYGDTAVEPRGVGVRRLKRLLLLLPLLILAGGWSGSRLDVALGRLHPVLRLEAALAAPDTVSDPMVAQEVEAFRGRGARLADLAAQADRVRRRLHQGGWWMGGFVGGLIGFSLIGLSLRRCRVDYEIDRAECLSCARCFEACPVVSPQSQG